MTTKRYERAMELLVLEPRAAVPIRLFVAVLFTALIAIALRGGSVAWGFSIALTVLLFGLSAKVWRPRPQWGAHVAVSRAGVKVNGDLIPAADIGHAFRVPTSSARDRDTVRVVSNVGHTLLEAYVEGEADADAFLEALGRDVAMQRITFRMDSPIASNRLAMGALGVFLLLVGVKLSLALAVPTLLVALGALFTAGAPTATVEVGADGVNIEWLWHERFVPYAELVSVERRDKQVRLVRASGAFTEITFVHAAATDVEALVYADAFSSRVEEALASYREGGSRQELTARLARGTRAPKAWLGDLGAIQQGGSDYRSSAVREEDLWSVLTDASAPADVRAAAAFILRKTVGDEAAPKLRIASDTVASPKLRVALEAAASGDDEELEAAVRDVAGVAETRGS